MQNNSRKGRGSQSRRPQPKSVHTSGSARSRHVTHGEIPPPLSGKHASNSEIPESSPITWATKLGANLTPTTNLPTPPHAVIPQTFHTVAIDTAAPLPFDNSPHLQLTRRFFAYDLPEYEILRKQIFPGDDLATRDCLLRLRTTPSEQVRSNLGVALKLDDHGDSITVVTRRTTPSSSKWVTMGDVKI